MKNYTITFILAVIVFIYDQVIDTANFFKGIKQLSENQATGFLLMSGYNVANVVRTSVWIILLIVTIVLMRGDSVGEENQTSPFSDILISS
jgi:hypothetical protein